VAGTTPAAYWLGVDYYFDPNDDHRKAPESGSNITE
jgi:hypothetical protein